MFAVPGWSVSADALKSETASSPGPSGLKSKKRKRNNVELQSVTSANVADLYEAVIEGKGGPPSSNQGSKGDDNSAKRAKKQSTTTKAAGQDGQPKSSKKDKKTKNKNGDQHTTTANDTQLPEPSDKTSSSKPTKPNTTSTPSAVAQTSLPPAPAKLTPLQASMREKLISARFRHLNETLYTRPSEESFALFQDSPEMFTEYHEGFRRQVKVWPENPVDSFLSDIRSRARAKPPVKGRPGPPPSQRNKMALPRTMGTCTIADLGCGDARLAESLQGDRSKLRLDIKSFDLQSPSALVTRADIANLPLEDGSVNVAIFCLALMGTNWIDFVEEAYRILHWKGELWVAEIKSRFGPARKNTVVEHSVGNRKKNNAALSKKVKAARDAETDVLHGEDLAVEVDGLEDRRRETDVTAFIEVLKKRGFVLQGERAEAVDLSNRMFVKMHFIKGASPTKGKGAKAEDASKMAGAHKKRKGFAPKWDEDEHAENAEDEASILKPCVYKIR
ncbi:25S rRNA (adenine645-N1)-methyltransferase [Metarhizium acridum]|uniref:Ribosomal RNA-processing protein 8 n=1 Tax=Metarhizium acridum (strain CQMa 102) TaxID=655827 RepID=E9DSX9_METAQ|nr:rRNA processing protein Rrp8, putative [Metarhizium acridum CQMa 102]EFY93489.1 rRNA processing protein Rrp8, putative [Metarhizium acridum CQMa 102]KAG8425349.1 25S rRNA (adenine645-N1)-methyltransferase [Metarhizium acridum]